MQETQVRFLGWEDTLEKGMTTYSSILSGESLPQKSLVGCSLWGHPPGRKGTSSREGWRSPVRSYNNVRVKIRMNGVSSLLRTNRKFHL